MFKQQITCFYYVELGMETTMGFEDEKHVMANTLFMKITGLYQLLSPHGPKIYGLNIFRCIAVVQILTLLIVQLWLIIHICYYDCDFHQVIQYLSLVAPGVTSILKMYYIVRYSSNIWDCIHSTSLHVLSYKNHNRRILEIGRMKSKSFSTFFTFLWLCVVASYLMSSIVLSNYYIKINVGNGFNYYRLNVLNLIFPVNDTFYNEHFLTYYYIESILAIIWGHSTLVFDTILISMCMTFSYQLRTIADSYSTFGFVHNQSTGKLWLLINTYTLFK